MAEVIRHLLENKYIIYEYIEQADEDAGEGGALVLFQLKKGRLRGVYHPMNGIWTEAADLGETQIDELLEIMRTKKIREVYSVWHSKDFFGIPPTWFSMQEEPEEGMEVVQWAEYCQIGKVDDPSYYSAILQEAGIRLLFFDADQNKIVEKSDII